MDLDKVLQFFEESLTGMIELEIYVRRFQVTSQ